MGSFTKSLTGGSSSSSSSRELSPQASEMYSSYVKPYAGQASTFATNALDYSSNLLGDNNYGTQNIDYGAYDDTAQSQIANAQSLANNLANGILPSSYTQNMQDSIQSGVQNTLGSALNTLGAKGVMNSSVTNKANADIANSASNTMAQQYQNNISQLSGLANQQAQLATAPITASSMAQQAALSPVSTLLGLSTNAENTGVNSPFNSLVGGTGTSSSSGGTSNSMLQNAAMLKMLFV